MLKYDHFTLRDGEDVKKLAGDNIGIETLYAIFFVFYIP